MICCMLTITPPMRLPHNLDSSYTCSIKEIYIYIFYVFSVIEKEGIKVAIDNDSLEFIRGSTLDFHEELIRSAFSIVNNPQAEQGCSCGASFSLKL